MNVPNIIIIGGNGSNPTEALLQSKLIKDLIDSK
jgi:6-phosphofructokinase